MNPERSTQSTKTSNVNELVASGVLQRKCACGQHTLSGAKCVECGDKKKLNQPLQTKLHIGVANDKYEQEADSVAEQVMRMSKPKNSDVNGYLWAASLVQRQVSNTQRNATEVPSVVHDVVRSTGQQLDQATRDFMEPRFGHDFSGVRIHTDAKAAESAKSVNALGYTVGNDVVFESAQYSPNTNTGKKLLAHELAHVVQQSSVRPISLGKEEVGRQVSERLGAGVERAGQDVSHRHPARVSVASAAETVMMQLQSEPTAEEKMIETARGEAYRRTQNATQEVGETGPYPDELETRRIRSLARRLFKWKNPNMEQIGDIVGKIRDKLMPSEFKSDQVPASNPRCEDWAAYVVGGRPPIHLCPAFFKKTPEQKVRTLIHEAAHLSGIGQSGGESYCFGYDCKTSCGGFKAADSWAHFVHCVVGLPADKAKDVGEDIEIKAKP